MIAECGLRIADWTDDVRVSGMPAASDDDPDHSAIHNLQSAIGEGG